MVGMEHGNRQVKHRLREVSDELKGDRDSKRD